MAIYINYIMCGDFQYCLLINSPTCTISFDRIILNHLSMVDQLHTFAKLSNIPCLPTRHEGWMGRLLVIDPKLHWMKILDVKIPKISENRLLPAEKVGMIHSSCSTTIEEKKMETLVLQGGNVQKQNVSRIQPAAHLSFDLFSRNPRSFTGCFESASMVWEKAGGLQELEIIYQTMGQICTTLTKLNFGHDWSCMVYQCHMLGREWGPF